MITLTPHQEVSRNPISTEIDKPTLAAVQSDAISTSYKSTRHSSYSDLPKIRQLHLNTIFRQDVDDQQWSDPNTMSKIETSIIAGGVEWMFKLQKLMSEGSSHLGFTIVCGAKLRSTLWRINANIKLIVREKDCEKFVERYYPSSEFMFACRTLADMIPWEEINTDLSLSNRPDTKSPIVLTFELEIDITKSYGFRRRAEYEYSFYEPSLETDMVLVIENKHLFVNATYLSMLSPFFRSLKASPSHDSYEEIQKETIMDVSVEEFLVLLHAVYPSQRPVTVDNVETLLKLADRYCFECILIKCEDFLISPPADEIDIFKRLEWASNYAMADLQDHCVSKLNDVSDVAAVKKTLLYGNLSHETRKLLLDLMLKFSNA
ncbi:BTB/POZ domain protein [Dictyocaulus viviparus]|uniref:BTB/POZ domain protein n=1 Tax=Dictyocaulus viviparus TaxID=29172 RepID=A0A0D8Y9X2_DICVI|nr:BTB/POZ domain protein [Dictyocaulus viviparus]